jgi:spectinomycin phosphotransferase
MIEKQPLSDQRIIDCLNTNYGIKGATLAFLPLGADINASVYKAETYNQSSYFIKVKRKRCQVRKGEKVSSMFMMQLLGQL